MQLPDSRFLGGLSIGEHPAQNCKENNVEHLNGGSQKGMSCQLVEKSRGREEAAAASLSKGLMHKWKGPQLTMFKRAKGPNRKAAGRSRGRTKVPFKCMGLSGRERNPGRRGLSRGDMSR